MRLVPDVAPIIIIGPDTNDQPLKALKQPKAGSVVPEIEVEPISPLNHPASKLSNQVD